MGNICCGGDRKHDAAPLHLDMSEKPPPPCGKNKRGSQTSKTRDWMADVPLLPPGAAGHRNVDLTPAWMKSEERHERPNQSPPADARPSVTPLLQVAEKVAGETGDGQPAQKQMQRLAVPDLEVQTAPDNAHSTQSGDCEDDERDNGGDDKRKSSSLKCEGSTMAPPPPLRPEPLVLDDKAPGCLNRKVGLKIHAGLARGPGGKIGLKINVCNLAGQPQLSTDWSLKIRSNPFGLAPASPLQLPDLPSHGDSSSTLILLTPNKNSSNVAPGRSLYLEVAVKATLDMFQFEVPFDLYCVLGEFGPAPSNVLQTAFAKSAPERTTTFVGRFAMNVTPDMVVQRCQQYYVYFVARTPGHNGSSVLYMSAQTVNRLPMYIELTLARDGRGVKLVCLAGAPELVCLMRGFLSDLLRVDWQPAAEQVL